ncbi:MULTISPECIES: type II secretion system F family protein [Clostridium]|uniref:type II secretion system F family protein n=1 Tax=Clostridium TaxID=1485 RepID=UPI0008255FF7|nr:MULTISPECIES: type II secretion system F family protein [Clostridium]PJI06581.1 hypothetical protein CUB90_01295 [Clostridium sp. CT7]
MMIIALHLVLFLAVIVMSYGITKFFINKNKIENILYYFDEKYKKRLLDKKIDKAYRKKRINVFGKFDSLIYSSGIRKHFKYMTSELFIFVVLILASLVSAVVYTLFSSIIFSIVAFVGVIFISYGILKELARVNFDKVDNSIMFFINSLKNNAAIENNIAFMMEQTTKRLKEPLKTYNMDFVSDVKMGISLQKAFDNYINKVENIRLKNILKNLYICSINNANYSKLLDKTRIVIKNYYENKEKRRRKVIGAQISIAVIIFVAGIILNALSGITNNFYDLLMKTTIGQILIGYMLIVILIAVYRCITLKEFNY